MRETLDPITLIIYQYQRLQFALHVTIEQSDLAAIDSNSKHSWTPRGSRYLLEHDIISIC